MLFRQSTQIGQDWRYAVSGINELAVILDDTTTDIK
jgi:hypothetical protein